MDFKKLVNFDVDDDKLIKEESPDSAKNERSRHASTPCAKAHNYLQQRTDSGDQLHSKSLSNLPYSNLNGKFESKSLNNIREVSDIDNVNEICNDDSSNELLTNKIYLENRDESFENLITEPNQNTNQEELNPSMCAKVFVMFVLTLANILNYMDRYTVAGVLQSIKEHFFGFDGENNGKLGLIQTSFIFSYMIFSPIFGYLGDRYNRKLLMIIGITFWSIVTLISSFLTQNFWVFLVMRALVGIGEASYSTIAPTIIADYFVDSTRSIMLAVFYFAIPVGSGLGYILSSSIAKATNNWVWSLRITPVMGVLTVFLMFFIYIPPRGASEGKSHLKASSVKLDLKYLSKNKSFIFSTLGFTCVSFVAGSLALWTPYYLYLSISLNFEEYGIAMAMDKEQINLWFGICTCITGFMGVCIGAFSARFFRRWTKKSDPLVCAAGLFFGAPLLFIVIMISRSNLPGTWIILFFSEICFSLNWSVVADILMNVVIPTRRSMAEAIQILVCHSFGDAGSPFLVGKVSDVIGQSMTNVTTTYKSYKSLHYANFMNCGVCLLGAIFFFINALYFEKDCKAVELIKNSQNDDISNASSSDINLEKRKDII